MRSSRRRGIPRVTLASPRPAKWKVLSVICVEGSPTDCAATHPTASPGAARLLRYRRFISRVNSSAVMPTAAARPCLPSPATAPAASPPPPFLLLLLPLLFLPPSSTPPAKYPGCDWARKSSSLSVKRSGSVPSVLPTGRQARVGMGGCCLGEVHPGRVGCTRRRARSASAPARFRRSSSGFSARNRNCSMYPPLVTSTASSPYWNCTMAPSQSRTV
mmetsp:Transcript_37319/g.92763  ORF Transcript_37319/g.92763 Transcript_37319/m.92763 type:complete len:217 (-) Transcript_37319:1414-2064(-)